MPTACIHAYTIVGPTNLNPRRFISVEICSETATLHLRGDLLGERRRRGHASAVTLQHPARGERPAELAKAFTPLLHLAVDPGALDGRLDLGAGADDAGVGHQSVHVRRAEPGDLGGVEPGERLAKGLAFSQHRDPGQPGLKALQHQHLPEHAGVLLRHAPLLIVIGAH